MIHKLLCPYCKGGEIETIGEPYKVQNIHEEWMTLQVFKHENCKTPEPYFKTFGSLPPRWTYQMPKEPSK